MSTNRGLSGPSEHLLARAVGPDALGPEMRPIRDEGRRPLLDWERPWLQRLGASLRAARRDAQMSQAHLAARAGIAERSVRRIEQGERRTRRSTLVRLAGVLAQSQNGRGIEPLLADLLLAVGPALAPETEYPQRVEARRCRRQRKTGRRFVVRHVTAYESVPGGVLESHRHTRRVSRIRTREREYQVLTDHEGRRHRLSHDAPSR